MEEDERTRERRRLREEKKRKEEEEERKQEEERKKREQERNARKEQRAKDRAEREEKRKKEIEEEIKRADEERTRRREERERKKAEEEQKAREDEERRQKQQEERDRKKREEDEEKRRKQKEIEEEKKRIAKELEEDSSGSDVDTHIDNVLSVKKRRMQAKQAVEQILQSIDPSNSQYNQAGELIIALLFTDELKDDILDLIGNGFGQLTDYLSLSESLYTMLSIVGDVELGSLVFDSKADIASGVASLEVKNKVAKMAGSFEILKSTAINLNIPRIMADSSNQHLLDLLFGIIENPGPLPYSNLHSFIELLSFYVGKKQTEVMNYISEHKDGILQAFMQHIYSSHIIDLLLKLTEIEMIQISGGGSSGSSSLFTLFSSSSSSSSSSSANREKNSWTNDLTPYVILKLNEILNPDATSEQLELEMDNINRLIVDIVRKYPRSKVAHHFMGQSFANSLLKNIFRVVLANPFTSPASCSVLQLFTTILDFTAVSQSKLAAIQPPADPPADLPPIINLLFKPLVVLVDEREMTPIQAINEIMDIEDYSQPFGIVRLTCMSVINSMVKCNVAKLDKAIWETGILRKCVEMFFQYESNNIIHCSVESILTPLIQRSMGDEDEEFMYHLLKDCGFVQRVVDILNDKKRKDEEEMALMKLKQQQQLLLEQQQQKLQPAQPEEDESFSFEMKPRSMRKKVGFSDAGTTNPLQSLFQPPTPVLPDPIPLRTTSTPLQSIFLPDPIPLRTTSTPTPTQQSQQPEQSSTNGSITPSTSSSSFDDLSSSGSSDITDSLTSSTDSNISNVSSPSTSAPSTTDEKKKKHKSKKDKEEKEKEKKEKKEKKDKKSKDKEEKKTVDGAGSESSDSTTTSGSTTTIDPSVPLTPEQEKALRRKEKEERRKRREDRRAKRAAKEQKIKEREERKEKEKEENGEKKKKRHSKSKKDSETSTNGETSSTTTTTVSSTNEQSVVVSVNDILSPNSTTSENSDSGASPILKVVGEELDVSNLSLNESPAVVQDIQSDENCNNNTTVDNNNNNNNNNENNQSTNQDINNNSINNNNNSIDIPAPKKKINQNVGHIISLCIEITHIVNKSKNQFLRDVVDDCCDDQWDEVVVPKLKQEIAYRNTKPIGTVSMRKGKGKGMVQPFQLLDVQGVTPSGVPIAPIETSSKFFF